jgi:hypothetical protein
MNIRRILISEQEKKSILSMYNVEDNVILEQKLNSDGTYTIMYDQTFKSQGYTSAGNTNEVIVRKGTVIRKNSDGKSVIFNVYYKDKDDNNKLKLAATKGVYYCGGLSIKYKDSNQSYTQFDNTFQKTISQLFCDGNKLKSDNKTVVNPQKDTTTKKCYTTDFTPTYNQICKLPNDNTWVYAKDDSGKWYTSRQTDTKKWCELVLPQYQKAVDTLVKGCPTTIEPIKLPIKPIDTTQPNQPELQLDPKAQLQQNLNTANKGREYLQSIQNKPQ